jgi:ribosomal protein L37AE/L43A
MIEKCHAAEAAKEKFKKGELFMKKATEDFCIECGEKTEFSYDGEQWVCMQCGSHNSQGDLIDSIPTISDDDLEHGK